VDLELIQDKAVLKRLRRSDKLSKMAVLAATDAVTDSGLGDEEKKRLGVIVATAFGAHVTTFEFLDGILDFGEAAVSPTIFSNSVHNAAASYISTALGIQGPTLTVTRFFFSFQAALQLAGAWLREGRVKHVLVGAADQVGDVMGYIAGSKLTLAPDGKIRPFQLKHGVAVPGEGAAFFLMGNEDSERAYCRVSGTHFGDDAGGPDGSDLDILDADGMVPDESVYSLSPASGTRIAAYSPVYGSMMTGSAFSLAAGALILKDRVCFPNPVLDNPHGLNIIRKPVDSSVDFIRCIRYNCSREKSIIRLRRI
jgi:3-oxoacyl-[acyl-carrier-protein] synthase II